MYPLFLSGFQWIAFYLIGINLFGLILFALDKVKAKSGKRRIAEKALFFVAVIGGAIGAIIGMRLFRHKTKHKSFRFGLPLILLAQIALVIAICCLV